MPIYEYHCTKCGDDFEKNTTVSLRDYVRCEGCQVIAMRKLSAPNIHMNWTPSISEFNNPKVKDMIPRDEMERKRKGI